MSNGPTNSSSVSIDVDAFIRSIGIRKNSPHMLFLGAGASVSSGMPTAYSCIWEWKRSIFLTNNPGLESQFSELSLRSNQDRIQTWIDRSGNYPPRDHPEEYGFYIEKCFPIAEDRRAYFQEKTRGVEPHIGYRMVCHLAEEEIIQSVWSTNFDGLMAKAASSARLTPIEVGIDSQDRANRPITRGELLCVSLHGDYRYDRLKNTPQELQSQEAELKRNLVETLRNTSTIVIGYSGRDSSVMDAFRAAYELAGTGTLYWCGFGDEDAPREVADLIRHARSSGRVAYYVPGTGFDDLCTRLALHCLAGSSRSLASDALSELTSNRAISSSPFFIEPFSRTGLLKSNAYPIQCPSELLSFELHEWPKTSVWRTIGETIGQGRIAAVPYGGKVLALGNVDEIRDRVGDNLKGRIERVPVDSRDYAYSDGAIVSLMLTALVRTIAEECELDSDLRKEVWTREEGKPHTVDGDKFTAYDSLQIFLRQLDGKNYCVVKPSVKVLCADGEEAPSEVSKMLKQRILGWQHNRPFNEALLSWRRLIFGVDSDATTLEFPRGSGSVFAFKVRKNPAFARIGVRPEHPTVDIPESWSPLLVHEGIELPEPDLVFATRQGSTTAVDPHPIRGLVNNRPYDFSLTASGLSDRIRVGVICAERESNFADASLRKIQEAHTPLQSEKDYLQEYPGFHRAFGLPLEIPRPGDLGWETCSEPNGKDARGATLSVATSISRCVERLQSAYDPHVVVVVFPKRWEAYREHREPGEVFDVHDFVKALCIQRGVASQFIDQETLVSSQACRVWWWLSLALYTKSMRTPWALNSLDENTAYVGIGFSIDNAAEKGDHIILGCSHIYSAHGEGLKYRLTRLKDMRFRRGNPFMSREDSRRTGESIRQLFFDAKGALPNRVVLHKRTPFSKDERLGLADGLGGVDYIDLVEIQVDSALRYIISSQQQGREEIGPDPFPVRRGTVLRVDDFTALLWVHGATLSVNPHRNYYQGKRRIPAPLIIRRHSGHSSLSDLSMEILSLSKMDWNSFDLYTKLPATLQSSRQIARIGSKLERFGASSYDYRLFI